MPRQRRQREVPKYAVAFWLDCPQPCCDVVHQNTIEACDTHPTLEEGQERIVLVGKTGKRQRARIVKLGEC